MPADRRIRFFIPLVVHPMVPFLLPRWCRAATGISTEQPSRAGRTVRVPYLRSIPTAARRIYTPLVATRTMGTLHLPGWYRAAMGIFTERPSQAGRATPAPCFGSVLAA